MKKTTQYICYVFALFGIITIIFFSIPKVVGISPGTFSTNEACH